MVQDKKKFTAGTKTNETSKNLDNRKAQAHTNEKDSARPGAAKDQNAKDRDMNKKRDITSRK